MKHRWVLAGLILVLAMSAGAAFGQRKPVKKPVKKPTPAKTTTILPPLEVRAAREKVDVQLSNVNGFLDKLGPLAVNLETADADARGGRLSPASVKKVEAAKLQVVQAIRDLKTALSGLEAEFRTKADLRKYLPNIEGITDLAATSEDSAIAGKFVVAKEPLRNVAQRLMDTLAVMPKSAPL